MSEILDHFEEKQNPKHTKNAFKIFLLSISLIAVSIVLTILLETLAIVLLLILGWIMSGFGLWESIKSLRSDEPAHWKKYVSLIGNGLIFGIPVILMLISFFIFFLKI